MRIFHIQSRRMGKKPVFQKNDHRAPRIGTAFAVRLKKFLDFGDEFVVLLPNADDRQAVHCAHTVLDALAAYGEEIGVVFQLSAGAAANGWPPLAARFARRPAAA